MDIEREKSLIYRKKTFKFCKNPSFIKLFNYNSENLSKELNNNNKIRFDKTFQRLGFRFGNAVSSIWFIVFLFYFQSYFLKQNLQKSESKFISD